MAAANPKSDTDWDTVTVLRKKAPTRGELRSQQAINQAMRTGADVQNIFMKFLNEIFLFKFFTKIFHFED